MKGKSTKIKIDHGLLSKKIKIDHGLFIISP